jgi:CheY-like chemotaxis protein
VNVSGESIREAAARRVLVVEDNYLIALDIVGAVEDCGAVAVGPAGSVAEALRLLDETPLTAAVLDINLGDERVWPVAEVLADRAIPFVFSSGYGIRDVPQRFVPYPILTKPVSRDALCSFLESVS